MQLSPDELTALWLSAKIALCCMIVCLPAGIAVAWLLARHEFRGKLLLESFVQLPMVLPPVVPGYLLLIVFGNRGVIGGFLHERFGLQLAFDWKGAVLASATMAFPLMVQPLRLAFQMIDRRLEHAAATLGASPWQVFATVSLPLAIPGMVAGAILCFSRALGEFGATMAFVGNIPGETRTVPLAIYSALHQPGGEAAAARLAALSILLAFAAMLVNHLLTRRSQRKLGYRARAEA